MHDLTLYLPWAPSINNYYMQGRRSGRYISKKGRVFSDQAGDDIMEQADISYFPLSMSLKINVRLCTPDRRKRDLDNYIKPLFDAITHSGLWVDYSLVDYFAVKRGKICKKGKIIVQISTLDST